MEAKEYTHYHKGGSVCARGNMLGEQMHGYWEWYRKDGSLKRSGYFEQGIQVGAWTTYDQEGKVHKVTKMKDRTAE